MGIFVSFSISEEELSKFTAKCNVLLEKAMASYSSTLARKIPMDGGAWWTAVHAVAESRT